MNSQKIRDDAVLRDFIECHDFRVLPHIVSQIEIVDVGINCVVLLKDDFVDHIFIVLDGRFSVETSVEDGSIFTFTHLGQNDFIGELEALSDIKISQYFVRSEIPARLLCLPVPAVKEWIESDTKFCAFLIQSLVKKFNSLASTASEYPFTSSLTKLAKIIVDYVEGHPSTSESVIVKLTRQEIGDNLGLSIRTVNRNLKKLKSIGAVYVEHGKIIVSYCKLEFLRTLYYL